MHKDWQIVDATVNVIEADCNLFECVKGSEPLRPFSNGI